MKSKILILLTWLNNQNYNDFRENNNKFNKAKILESQINLY